MTPNPSLWATLLVLMSLNSALAQTVVSIEAIDDTAAETAAGEAANPGVIRIFRTGSVTGPLTVWLRVRGTATVGTDYTFSVPVGAFVSIPAGRSSIDLVIQPRDDAFLEVTEEVRIDLEDETSGGAPVPYGLGGSRAEVQLRDNEDPSLPPRAVISVSAVGSTALEAASNPVLFRLVREGNLTVPVQVYYGLGGTATVAQDYEAPPETIAFAAGVTVVDVPVVALNDTAVEPAETVTFTLRAHPHAGDVPPPVEAYALGFSTNASVTLISEDLPPPPVVTMLSPVQGSSQAAPGTIEVRFQAVDTNGYITRFSLMDGGTVLASNGVTYPTPPAAGTPFEYSTVVTNVRAGLHVFRARAWSQFGVMGSSESVQSVVTNIPPVYPKMSVTAVDAEAAEGLADGAPNVAVFAITVDAPMPTPQYVVYRLSSPGPGDDFVFPAGYSATNWPMYWPVGPTDYGYAYFPTGVTRVEVVVAPVDDVMNEGTETLTLTLSYPFVFTERTFEGIVQFTEGGFHTPPFDPYALPPRYFDYDLTTNNVATAVIVDNDTEPTPFAVVSVAATDAEAEEIAPGQGAPNVGVFTISRVGPTNLPLQVNYALTARPRDIPLRFPLPVQAQNGVDFVAIPNLGVATIPAGAVSTEIVIVPIADGLSEIPEYVQLQLRPSLVPLPSPLSYLLHTNALASLVIRDLPLPAFTPVLRIRASDAQAIEDAVSSRTGALVVERNGSVTEALTVPYLIGGTAINGEDYVRLPGTVTIPAGGRFATIVVNPYADGVEETNESVSITLLPPAPEVYPPPYVLSSAGTMSRSAGVSIRDHYLRPGQVLNRYQRALLIRRNRFQHHVIVPLPPAPVPAAAEPVPDPAPALMAWAVEASTDLVAWEEIGTTEDPEEFVDVTDEALEHRFYRFRQVPPTQP